MTRLLAAICELPSGLQAGDPGWTELQVGLRRLKPDLLLLNEMPWGPWVAATPAFDDGVFDRLCDMSEAGLLALPGLDVSTVVGTRPRRLGGRRLNEGFVWTRAGGYQGVHAKAYFPEEPGFHESHWFDGGDNSFTVHEVHGLRLGFQICTEVMFNERARRYGRDGAHLIVAPRATEGATFERWRVALQMAAMVSGCWVLSSNRYGLDGGVEFGGSGLIVDPRGNCVAATAPAVPLAAMVIDTAAAEAQQERYPCYVRELP